MLQLSRKVIHAHKTKRLVTGFIYGKYADGKTSYLLHTAQEVFKNIHKLQEVDAWLMALDSIFFSPIEALMFVETYRSKHENERVILLGMDDVGQHIPRARWWREDVVQFREWMTVARTDCASVLFTAPTQLSLPGGIIDSCFLRIRVKKHPEERGMSIALGYEVSVSPYFQVNVSGPKFKDEFPTHYPDYVFKEYTSMRENMVTPLRRNLMKLMGIDKTIETLHEMGATQKAIGEVVNRDKTTICKRLKNLNVEKVEFEPS